MHTGKHITTQTSRMLVKQGDVRSLGRRTTGRPHLRYKDVCIRDMKAVDIDTMSGEGLAADRTKWRSVLKKTPQDKGDKLMTAAADKGARRKEGSSSIRPVHKYNTIKNQTPRHCVHIVTAF